MTLQSPSSTPCEQFLAALDASTPPENVAATWRAHLAECENCRLELEARTKMMNRLRQAHQNVPTPPYLESRIRAAIAAVTTDADRSHQRSLWAFPPWASLAVMTVLAVAGFGIAYELGHLRLTQASQDAYVASISNRVASIMRAGLGDHVHCAYFRKFPKNAPVAAASLRQELGPEYRDLVDVVRRSVPGRYQLVIAHRCKYQGRQFIHLAAQDGGSLVSLVITRKGDGESFSTGQLPVSTEHDGVRFYQAGVQRFAINAFETPQHLVYTISDWAPADNQRVLSAMASGVRQILDSVER